MDVSTSPRVSSSTAIEDAALPLGPSTSRRTETLFAFANAASIVDISASAMTKRPAIRNSVPLNIETFAANDVLWPSSLRYRFHGHIPSNATVHAERDAGHSFQN